MTDLRYAIRVLTAHPAFSIVAIGTLAVGIGLNVAVFSILNVLLFKPLPVANADELVWITGRSIKAGDSVLNLSHADLRDFRGATGAVEDAAAFSEAICAVATPARALRVTGQVVTGNYFDLLGLSSANGRLLTARDDRPGADPVAVVSEHLARELSDAAAPRPGQTITINGRPHTIVGVAARGFRGVDVLTPADVWIPVASAQSVLTMGDPYARDAWWLKGLARLKPGVTLPEAQAVLGGVARAIAQRFPASHAEFSVDVRSARGAAPDHGSTLSVVTFLPAVPAVILLIACANVAGLVLARAAGRTRELAVRAALGAGSARLMRQLFVESLVIAMLGGAGGLLLSLWAPDLLLRLADAPLAADFSPDGRVLLFTAAVSAATAILFGLAPALRVTRPAGMAAGLRGTPGAALSGAARSRLQRALVGAQIGMSLVLLLTAGTFITSVIAARRTHVGFEIADRVTLSLDLGALQYTADRAVSFRQTLLDRLSAVPGIRSVTMASFVPLGDRVLVMPTFPEGQPVDPDAPPQRTVVNFVETRFFETLELPLRRGRALDARDRMGPPVAVVNERFARRLAEDGGVIGRRFSLGAPAAAAVEIVGIAGDVVVDEFGGPREAAVYVPMPPAAGELSVIAWTTLEPAAALRAIETQVRGLDAAVATFDPMTMTQHLGERLDTERGLSRLLAVAGGLALGLAAFGLYGVTACAVSWRTREIGVRIALGADRARILRLVLGDAGRLAAIGLVAGVVPGLAVTTLLSGQIFGARPIEPAALLVSAGLLAMAALAAAYAPARRALRVDPIAALRAE